MGEAWWQPSVVFEAEEVIPMQWAWPAAATRSVRANRGPQTQSTFCAGMRKTRMLIPAVVSALWCLVESRTYGSKGKKRKQNCFQLNKFDHTSSRWCVLWRGGREGNAGILQIRGPESVGPGQSGELAPMWKQRINCFWFPHVNEPTKDPLTFIQQRKWAQGGFKSSLLPQSLILHSNSIIFYLQR